MTQPVEPLFNKLLRCLILTFREISKHGDWYLKLSNRSEISQTEQQHSRWFSWQITERSGIFYINIAASILQESRCQLSPNRYRCGSGLETKMEKWKNGPKTHSADPPRTPASAPPPHHHSINMSQESGVFYLQQQKTSHQTMTEIPTTQEATQRYNEIGTSLKRNNNLEWC